ncbi:Hcp family type VI secretion system effector [Serratia sp. S1B]|nr:Hcp family type VI secretion system effector [Serratia sp. S1B]
MNLKLALHTSGAHLEQLELRYEKITWTYKEGNIIYSDSWNERTTA